jgi:YfiH family protein
MEKTFEQRPSSGVMLEIFGENLGVRHAFATKYLKDEKCLARALNVEGTPVVSVRQLHGDGVLVLDRPAGDWETAQKKIAAAEGAEGYDAIVTNQSGVILAVRTADCLPVLIFDPERRVIAAVHSGWRGALREVVPKAVRCMADRFSCRPSAMIVGIGPSIQACCFEVGEMVLAPLSARYPYWRELTKEIGEKKAMMNLQELVRRQLLKLGIPENRIETAQACTRCDMERFVSYRRDGKKAWSMWSGILMEAA